MSLFCLGLIILDVARPLENDEVERGNNKDGDKNRIKKDREGGEGSGLKRFHNYNILLFCFTKRLKGDGYSITPWYKEICKS